MHSFRSILLGAVTFLLVALAPSASANTLLVTDTGLASASTCTLAQAIYAANRANNPGNTTPVGATTVNPLSDTATATPGVGSCASAAAGQNTIQLPTNAAISYSTDSPDNFWYGPNALPPIASTITIEGNGATLSIVVGTSPRLRFFFVGADPASNATPGYNTPGPGNLVLHNLTLSSGRQLGGSSFRGGGGAGMGGAIFNQGTTTLDAVTLSGNMARGGTGSSSSGNIGGGGLGADAAPLVNRGYDGGGMGGSVPLGSSDKGANADASLPFGAAGGGTSNGMAGHNQQGVSGADGNGAGGGGYGYPPSNIGGGGGGGGGFGGGHGGSGSGPASNGTGVAGGAGGAFAAGGIGGNTSYTGGGGGGGIGGGGGGCNNAYCGNGGFGGGGGYSAGNSTPGAGGGFGGGGASPSGAAGFGAGSANFQSGGYGGAGAGFGGAIFNHAGTLSLRNSTLTGNSAIGASSPASAGGTGGGALGGAIFNLNGRVSVIFSTLASNTVTGGTGDSSLSSPNGTAAGGAIYSLAYNAAASTGSTSAALTLQNSILATTSGGNDLVVDQPASVSSGSNVATVSTTAVGANLVMSSGKANNAPALPVFTLTANPNLAALANNGGPTATLALNTGSPAIHAGTCSITMPPTDQRGYVRVTGTGPDLGAYQSASAFLATDIIFSTKFEVPPHCP